MCVLVCVLIRSILDTSQHLGGHISRRHKQRGSSLFHFLVQISQQDWWWSLITDRRWSGGSGVLWAWETQTKERDREVNMMRETLQAKVGERGLHAACSKITVVCRVKKKILGYEALVGKMTMCVSVQLYSVRQSTRAPVGLCGRISISRGLVGSVTQAEHEEGHTQDFNCCSFTLLPRCLLSFISRGRVQPSLSPVDRARFHSPGFDRT